MTGLPSGYDSLYLSGRCANGAQRDCGLLYHAVNLKTLRALCGAKPGRRSAGWHGYSDDPTEDHGDVSCPRCMARLTIQTGEMK